MLLGLVVVLLVAGRVEVGFGLVWIRTLWGLIGRDLGGDAGSGEVVVELEETSS